MRLHDVVRLSEEPARLLRLCARPVSTLRRTLRGRPTGSWAAAGSAPPSAGWGALAAYCSCSRRRMRRPCTRRCHSLMTCSRRFVRRFVSASASAAQYAYNARSAAGGTSIAERAHLEDGLLVRCSDDDAGDDRERAAFLEFKPCLCAR